MARKRTNKEEPKSSGRKPRKKSVVKTQAMRSGPAKSARPQSHDKMPHEATGLYDEIAQDAFEVLTRWQHEMTRTAKQIAAVPGDAATGGEQYAAFLHAQKNMLEQVKVSLSSIQDLITSCEHHLKPANDSAPERAAAGAHHHHPMLAMHDVAASNLAAWSKSTQPYLDMWFGALQFWMPMAGAFGNLHPESRKNSAR